MTKIMLSIAKKWCDKILPPPGEQVGEKFLEIRKDMPRQPIAGARVHLYETKADGGSGLVVGKFTLVGASPIAGWTEKIGEASCLSCEEFEAYAGGKPVYGWVIADPRRFKKPVSIRSYGFSLPPQSWCYITQGEPSGEELPEPGMEALIEEEKTIHPNGEPFGICEFCGQVKWFPQDVRSRKELDEAAARACTCADGIEYRFERTREDRWLEEISRAELKLEELFGEAIQKSGRTPVSDEQMSMLSYLAEQVIRCQVKAVTVEISGETRAKISQSGKGVTVIARTDTNGIKTEV